ncbi:MAG: peptide ABC transporter substrate-binding protein, partial [Actinomycetota bacterium]
MRSRLVSRATLSVILALAASACTASEAPGPRPQGGSIRIEGEEPGSLDPAHADDPAETRIVRNLFRGLVGFDETRGSIQPATASRFTVSTDSRTFEFTLRRNDRFSNGEPVTAESFARAFARATAPVESSPIAGMFSEIQGFAERRAGKTPNLSGVVPLDDYTLRITLSAPNAEFPATLTHPAFSPIPSDAAMLAREPSWGESPIGNGPWQLKEPWKHNESIVLEPNPQYTGPDRPNLKEAVFVLLDDVGVSYDQWLAGNLDWAGIPPAQINAVRAQNPGEIVTTVTPHLVYLIATGRPPTNDVTFRRAVSLAIARDVIARGGTWSGRALASTGLVPPGIPGYRRPDNEQVGPCAFCRLDAAEAKRLLSASGVRLDGPLPLQHLPDQEQWVDAVARNLKQNLGIDTRTHKTVSLSFYADQLRRRDLDGFAAYEVELATPSPDGILFPIFQSRSTGLLNLNRYANPEVDRLLGAARAERDATARIALYRQAED